MSCKIKNGSIRLSKYIKSWALWIFLILLFSSCEEEKPVILGELAYPLYCRTLNEPLFISDKNIVGKWEIYDIIDVENDTTYMPACNQGDLYMPYIEFTDLSDTVDNVIHFISNINTGVNSTSSFYTFISEDSLAFDCYSTTLTPGSDEAMNFEDVFGISICKTPLRIKFTKYFLVLANRENVELRFIIFPD